MTGERDTSLSSWLLTSSSTLKSSAVVLTSLNSVIEAAAELLMLVSLSPPTSMTGERDTSFGETPSSLATISSLSFCLVSACTTLSAFSASSASASRRHRFSGHSWSSFKGSFSASLSVATKEWYQAWYVDLIIRIKPFRLVFWSITDSW